MQFLLDQLTVYGALFGVSLISSILWLIPALIVARIFELPVQKVRLMTGGSRTYNVLGYKLGLGWLPIGSIIEFAPNTLEELPTFKLVVFAVAPIAGPLVTSLILYPQPDLLLGITSALTNLWHSILHPWDIGGAHVYNFGELAKTTPLAALGKGCFYVFVNQLIFFPGMGSLGRIWSKILPLKIHQPLATIGSILAVLFMAFVFVACIKASLLSWTAAH